MPLDVDALRKQPQKLRKSLKKLKRDSSPAKVHQLRTRIRRLEAMLHAPSLDSRKNERLLLKALKPVRKKAGKVRDMDVLTGFASQLQTNKDQECSVRLLEHLGNQRQGFCRKLEKTLAGHGPEVRQRLKKYEQFLDKALYGKRSRMDGGKWPAEASALALQAAGELRNWPALNRRNLHPFRLKVKELRYVLQMASDSDDRFIATLGEVKGAIGEWHDLEELAEIASQVVQHPQCPVLQEIRSDARAKFDHALMVANRVRKQNLGGHRKSRGKLFGGKPPARVGQAVMASASALAA